MMTLTEEITLAESNGKRVGWRGWLALIVLMLPDEPAAQSAPA